jgi:hypothetical protein
MVAPIIAAAIPKVIDIFGDALQSLFPDSAEREQKRLEYALKVQETLNQIDLAQIEVNKVEAASASLFVAGWRPFIGWVCGFAFAYALIVQPFLAFILAAYGHPVKELPVIDSELLGWAMGGMLGLGTMRTVEKVKGVTTGMTGMLPWRKP